MSTTTSLPRGFDPLPSWSRRTPSLSFTEHQRGFFAPPDPSDPVVPVAEPDSTTDDADIGVDQDTYVGGYEVGTDIGSSLDFTVHIEYQDLTAVLSNASWSASMSGTVIAPVLSRQSLNVTQGSFVLLAPDPTRVETSHMQYWMTLRSVKGAQYRLFGFKVIHEGPEWAAWPDSTTLYVSIRRFRAGRGWELVGRGITRVSAGDFADLLRSMQVGNVSGGIDRLRYKAGFGRLLGRALFEHYGGSFAELHRFPTLPVIATIPHPREWDGKPLILLRSPRRGWFNAERARKKTKKRMRRAIAANDIQKAMKAKQARQNLKKDMKGVFSRLIRYGGPGQDKGPVILAPGLGMASWSFTLGTIEENLVEFLIRNGYEVWLFDYRGGIDLPSAGDQFTLDDVAEDWTGAIDEVRRRSKGRSVQCVGHCVGSVGLLMAVLKGARGVRSMVCGQFTLFPYTSTLNLAKNYLGVGELLDLLDIETVSPDTAPTARNTAIDLALRPIPMPRGERCGLSVCRWINAIYGLTHAHAQFNDETHAELGNIFGIGNLAALRHIGKVMVHKRVLNAEGKDVYLTDEKVKNLDMPIHFLAGERNYIFKPKGTRKTIEFLSKKNRKIAKKAYYSADFIPGYAHLDTMIGRNASRDIFPLILEQLNRHEELTS